MKWLGKGLFFLMDRKGLKKVCGIMLSLLVVALNYSSPVQRLLQLPDALVLRAGEETHLSFGLPLRVQVDQPDAAVISSGDETLRDVAVTGVELSALSEGQAQVRLSLFGGWPFKNVDVRVEESRVLVPGGQAIGVALHTSGVLVVGTSDLAGGAANPAQEAGLQPGDVIRSIDGQEIENAQHLTQLVNARGGETVEMVVQRTGREMHMRISPVRDALDGQYRLGVWVRDSTAGVGTLSFYDPESGAFGALGHAITDVDTGESLTVRDGDIMHADIVDVLKGQRGEPGELKGSFLKEGETFGSILLNNAFGIYGQSDEALVNPLYPQGLPVGSRYSVHEGKASILSTVEGDTVREYEVEITRCVQQGSPAQKGMILRVTDPELLERTGGIVQGMSGSPILQDGHIIGAVTHVYVNDPTQGYGMYIEWMLEQAKQAKAA